jgi:hypothetical protein
VFDYNSIWVLTKQKKSGEASSKQSHDHKACAKIGADHQQNIEHKQNKTNKS